MEFVNYHLDIGRKPVILKRGKKRHSVVIMEDTGIRVMKVPLIEEKYMTTIENYSLNKACIGMLNAAKDLGITREAKRILLEGKEYENSNKS